MLMEIRPFQVRQIIRLTLKLPALTAFEPEFLFISAGFDAHADDPLASLMLTDDDYSWATQKLMGVADRCCEGRLVSLLEGGYDPHNEPWTAAQLATGVRIVRELAALKRWTPRHRDDAADTLLRHRQCVRIWGGPPTACDSGRADLRLIAELATKNTREDEVTKAEVEKMIADAAKLLNRRIDIVHYALAVEVNEIKKRIEDLERG